MNDKFKDFGVALLYAVAAVSVVVAFVIVVLGAMR